MYDVVGHTAPLPAGRPAALSDGRRHARRPGRVRRPRHRHVRLRPAHPQRPQRPAVHQPRAGSTSRTPAMPRTTGRSIRRARATPAGTIRGPICGTCSWPARWRRRRLTRCIISTFTLTPCRRIREAIEFRDVREFQTGVPSTLSRRQPSLMTPSSDVVRSSSPWRAPAERSEPAGSVASVRPVLGIFYFMILLPMKQRQQKVQEFQAALKVGDKVVTTGGIYGISHRARRAGACSCRSRQGAHRCGRAPPSAAIRARSPSSARARPRNVMNKNLRWKFTRHPSCCHRRWPIVAVLRRRRSGQDQARARPEGRRASRAGVKTDDALKLETETSVEQLREALKTANVAGRDDHVTDADSLPRRRRAGRPGCGVPPALADAVEPIFDRASGAGGTYTFTMKPNIDGNAARRSGDAGAADHRAPRQRARRRRADRRAARRPATRSSCSCPASPTSPRQGDHRSTGAARAEARRGRARRRRSETLLAGATAASAARHGGRARRRADAAGDAGDRVLPRAARRRRSPAATCATREPSLDENNLPAVSFSLNSEGARKFGARHRREHRPPAGDRPRRPGAVGADASRARIYRRRPHHGQLHAAGSAGPVARCCVPARCRRR